MLWRGKSQRSECFIDRMGEANHRIQRVAALVTIPGEILLIFMFWRLAMEISWQISLLSTEVCPWWSTQTGYAKSAVSKKETQQDRQASKTAGRCSGLTGLGQTCYHQMGPFWEHVKLGKQWRKKTIASISLHKQARSSPIGSAASSPWTEIEMDAS